MITIPIFDMMILPGVTFFFKKDIFTDQEITAEHVGEDVLFLMMKQDKKREDMTPEDICPIGFPVRSKHRRGRKYSCPYKGTGHNLRCGGDLQSLPPQQPSR